MKIIKGIKCYGELEKCPNKDGFYSIKNNDTIEGYLYDDLVYSKYSYVKNSYQKLNGYLKIVNRTAYILCGDILNKRVYEILMDKLEEFDTIINPWGTNIPEKKIKIVHTYWFNKGKDVYSYTADADNIVTDDDYGYPGSATWDTTHKVIPSYHHNDITDTFNLVHTNKRFYIRNHKCEKFYTKLNIDEIFYLVLLYNYITVDGEEYHIGNCNKGFIVKEIKYNSLFEEGE